jgi:NADH-quinone oxidoreductase subunit G
MSDEGRYGFGAVDDPSRITTALRRGGSGLVPVTVDEAVASVAAALTQAPEQAAVIASPWMSNEDLIALRRLVERVGIRRVAFRVPPARPGFEDDLLIRADKNPNTRGAELIGLDGDIDGLLADVRAGRIRCLWVFHHDLIASGLPPAETRAALGGVETLIWSGTNASGTSAMAGVVLPSAAWVERDGTFTNFEGRVQRFRAAVEPLGEAVPDWDLLGRVLRAVGAEVRATRAEHWFRELAASVPAFAGMTYASVGDTGQPVAQAPEAVRA